MRKTPASQMEKEKPAFELGNILFMGTSVISGSGIALVLRTGDGKHISCQAMGLLLTQNQMHLSHLS